MPEIVLLTFPSTYQALKAEKVIQGAGLTGRLIPMPREVSSLCGLALELDPTVDEEAAKLLIAAGVKLEKRVKAQKERGRFLILEAD